MRERLSYLTISLELFSWKKQLENVNKQLYANMLFITKMIESNLQKTTSENIFKFVASFGTHFNENDSGADGLRTKTYRFFLFGWYQNRRKSMKNR